MIQLSKCNNHVNQLIKDRLKYYRLVQCPIHPAPCKAYFSGLMAMKQESRYYDIRLVEIV